MSWADLFGQYWYRPNQAEVTSVESELKATVLDIKAGELQTAIESVSHLDEAPSPADLAEQIKAIRVVGFKRPEGYYNCDICRDRRVNWVPMWYRITGSNVYEARSLCVAIGYDEPASSHTLYLDKAFCMPCVCENGRALAERWFGYGTTPKDRVNLNQLAEKAVCWIKTIRQLPVDEMQNKMLDTLDDVTPRRVYKDKHERKAKDHGPEAAQMAFPKTVKLPCLEDNEEYIKMEAPDYRLKQEDVMEDW